MKMKVSNLDKGIANLITTMNENDFRPFASCDGLLKNHITDDCILDDVLIGYVCLLDSENSRNLISYLMDDVRYKILIEVRNEPINLYGNQIQGVIFAIYFNNCRGGIIEELEEVVRKLVISKNSVKSENRKRIDQIISILTTDNINRNLSVTVGINSVFSLPYVRDVLPNFSIEVMNCGISKSLIHLAEYVWEDVDYASSNALITLLYDFNKLIEQLKLIDEKYDELLPYAESKFKYGKKQIEECMRAHIEDTNIFLEELVNKRIVKSIRRHYRKAAQNRHRTPESY